MAGSLLTMARGDVARATLSWALLPIALGTVCAACARVEPPRWTGLAQGYRAPIPHAAVASWREHGVELVLREDPDDPTGVWVERTIAPPEWRLLTDGHGWFAPRPLTGRLRHREGEHVRLRLGERELERLDDAAFRARAQGGLRTDCYSASARSILLRLGDAEELPSEPAVLSTFLERGRSVDGAWRTTVEGIVGQGLPLWSGERVELVLDVAQESALSFRLAYLPLGRVVPAGEAAASGTARLQVEFQGKSVLDVPWTPSEETEVYGFHVPLPERRVAGARLVLTLEGPPAVAALLEPVLAPARVGARGDRPWSEPRPDLLVVVADTLRADALAAWGGAPDVAPRLNALAARSRSFLDARATSVWTLPTHASMFTGLFPLQHGAVAKELTFPEELETIAELLSRHGYRTGAITEGGFVSRHWSLDQGFGFFDEFGRFDEQGNEARSLRDTLADAERFLAHDDGRPVFLFVHTYRAHAPYRTGPEEDASANDELLRRIAARMVERGESEVSPAVVDEFRGEYHGLYLEGVRALDEALGEWIGALEQRGFLDHGALLFTSDHGEEFYEHGHRFHGWAPNEEKVRIPLFLRGAGIEPGTVTVPASQVDIAPTLAALAGVAPLAAWAGHDLLSLQEARALPAYNRQEDGMEFLSVVDGGRKVIATGIEELSRCELHAAYDLRLDPEEARDLAGSDAPWLAPTARAAARLWEVFSEPVGTGGGVTLDGAALEELRALGYVE